MKEHETCMELKLNQSVLLKLSLLEANKGQIEGLPKNPRIFRGEKLNLLIRSIKDNPEMTSLREILVYPHNGKYVVIGGNMRLKAMKELGYKEAPCKIIPEGTSVEQLNAYTIKDNSGFGEWDFNLLAKEWDIELLNNCDIELPNIGIDAPTAEYEEPTEEEQQLLMGVIDKADALLEELDAYEELNGNLILWFYNKYQEQE